MILCMMPARMIMAFYDEMDGDGSNYADTNRREIILHSMSVRCHTLCKVIANSCDPRLYSGEQNRFSVLHIDCLATRAFNMRASYIGLAAHLDSSIVDPSFNITYAFWNKRTCSYSVYIRL
jgi:hypothetical protein